jgi:histone deacetylase complex regulatory component SIN3
MKKYVVIMMLGLCVSLAAPSKHSGYVFAEEVSFEAKLNQIEENARMLTLVLKKLTRSFKKAKKNHDFMLESGLSEGDASRLEKAYEHKLKSMIDDAVKDINKI